MADIKLRAMVVAFEASFRMVWNSIVKKCAAVASYRCPCCSRLTLRGRGMFEICPVCFWEDDGQDEHDADVVRGGPNRTLSLTVARQNYLEFGAADPLDLPHVRSPTSEES
ncbi:CPCC family cysteine-rich protein [Sphingomonas melonis]